MQLRCPCLRTSPLILLCDIKLILKSKEIVRLLISHSELTLKRKEKYYFLLKCINTSIKPSPTSNVTADKNIFKFICKTHYLQSENTEAAIT